MDVSADQKHSALSALAAQVKRDLARVNYPPRAWTHAAQGPGGEPVLDALIIGGGMYGQTAAFALFREGIRNIRVIDRARRGEEGPWGTFARMEILRSPKHATGPDLGIPSLTFRAWYEAQHGEAAWDKLYKVHRLQWLEYLLWVRDTLELPIENEVGMSLLEPFGSYIRATLETKHGRETVLAREVVLATGREGTGDRHVPEFPSFSMGVSEAHGRAFHSADVVPFKAFRGASFGILGANASAFDNSAVALETGAGTVSMFCRRPFLPQVNKARWMGFSGFLNGFPHLSDAERWRFASFATSLQMPPPHESVLRCTQHPGFSLNFAEPWQDVVVKDDGVTVVTAKGEYRFDAVIFGTGFAVDISLRPELAPFRGAMMLWRDRVSADEAARSPQLARFPYLGPGFEFVEREPGQCPALRHLHVISYGAAMSHGALAGDIPGLTLAATQAAQSISRAIFSADFDMYDQDMRDFEEAELEPTPFFVPRDQRFRS